jgi:hypothetical protein
MAGIILEINVDDRGTVKVKQFADESKKAFKEMTEGPKQAQGPLNSLRDSWVSITAKAAIASAAFYTVRQAIWGAAVQIASATNDIERQAAVLGITTDEFQKWTYAAKMSDVNAQELAIGIKLLSRNMEDASTGAGDAAKYFSAMGVSVKTTEGHLRPLNDVMGDIMDKFSSWEEGPRKIAIAMQLFGRSGETLIPLLNKGRTGFNELAAEAQKLGLILSPELIHKGSEAEDIFKKINAQINAFKLSFAPAALEVAKFGNDLINVFNTIMYPAKKFLEISEKIKNAWMDLGKKIGIVKSEELMAWEPGPTPIPKAQPPAISGAYTGPEAKDVLSAWESIIEKEKEWGEVTVARQELVESGWLKEKGLVEEVREELEKLEREANEWGEITVGRQELVEAKWAADAKKLGEMDAIWKSFAENISSVWSENVTGMIKGTTKFSDAFKNLMKGIADAFISSVAKMISQWLLFGSITGKEGGEGFFTGGFWSGITGLIGGLFHQQGGIFNRPTLGIIGEAGPEAVIPLKGGKIPIEGGGGYNVTIVNINATDVKSFEDQINKNPGAIIKIIQKSVRARGEMRDIIRGA